MGFPSQLPSQSGTPGGTALHWGSSGLEDSGLAASRGAGVFALAGRIHRFRRPSPLGIAEAACLAIGPTPNH